MMRREIGADKVEVFFLRKMKFAKINSAVNNNVKKVVLFGTYFALIGESQGGGSTKADSSRSSTGVEMILTDYLLSVTRPRTCPNGAGKPTQTGQRVLGLQNKLPKARVSVDLWVEMLHKFTEAADLIDAEKKMKKKYLCITSKVSSFCPIGCVIK